MFKRTLIAACVALAALGTTSGALAALKVGDPAPALKVKEFVKGQPVTELAKGKIHVVEFWATWCPPCITSIPHISKLQKKFPEAIFIGVSVLEEDQAAVKPFVEKMGDKMAYRVAMDTPGESGVMAKTWMEAAGQNSIPTAFIINGEGKIAWIGHPMEMDKPLAGIVAGTFDVAAAAAQAEKENAADGKIQELADRLQENQDHPDKMLALLDQALKEDPKLESIFGMTKFQILLEKDGGQAGALEYGSRLVGTLKDEAEALNELAWSIVDPEDEVAPSPELVKLALKAALRSDELTESSEAAVADTLAKAYFDDGQVAKAVEAQERALLLAKGTELEEDESLAQRLAQYKAALKQ